MSRFGAQEAGANKAIAHRSRSPWLKGLGSPDQGTPDNGKPSIEEAGQTPAAPERDTSEGLKGTRTHIPGREDEKSSISLLRRSLARVWRTRGIWLGLIGLGCALYGQKLVTEGKDQAVVSSIHWYTAGIILVIIAWAGTY